MTSIPLIITTPHACNYLEDEQSQSVFVNPDFPINNTVYSQLIQKGFRRSGDHVYVPHCPNCVACIPARIPVNEFQANRSQQRCWRKNEMLSVVIKPPQFELAHYRMYMRYQNHRHTGGDMALSSPEDYIEFLSSSWCDTVFVEFSLNNELAALAVVDKLNNALSAVYTFFEPKFANRGLGVYAVLWQIEQAKLWQKDFVYLGFWIESCKKMAYKIQYQPLEILQNREWHKYEAD